MQMRCARRLKNALWTQTELVPFRIPMEELSTMRFWMLLMQHRLLTRTFSVL
nr:MAG TPA: hypothetical protein [Caudoviricetes sp.]